MASLGISLLLCLVVRLSTLGDHGLGRAQNVQVVIDFYPNTTTVKQGTTLILMCRVVGVPSTTVLSYQWTCPGGYCDAGGVDPEWAARIQQDNILVVNVRRQNADNGMYTCTVQGNTQQVGTAMYALTVANGLSLSNEDGGLRVFFPRNSFVANTTLTHTNTPRQEGGTVGNDHIVCYSSSTPILQMTWHNSNGQLIAGVTPCRDCGGRCLSNGAVCVDPQDNEHTDIHMYTDSTAYVNQDLECRVSGGQSSFIGVYLINGVSTTLQTPSSVTQGAASTTTVSVSWSQLLGATGYYVSYQRQDLGTPPVVTPQYERIVGGATTSVTLRGLEPGTTYRIRVWSTDGTSVSSGAGEVDVMTMESVPTRPRMLTMIGGLPSTGSAIELNWLPPLHPNGAIHYEIEYVPAVTPGELVNAGSSSSLYFTLSLPNEFITYSVRVAAVNTQGRAQSDVLEVCPGMNRQSDILQPPTGVSVDITGTDTAVVSWNAQQSRMCDVVVGNYSVRYQLTNDTCSPPITVYTFSTSVTLNDLVPNAVYSVSVATITLGGGGTSAFSATTTFTVPATAPPLASGTSVGGTVGAAIGGFIGGVLLTAAIGGTGAGAMLYRVKREMSVPAQKPPATKVYEDPQLQDNPAYGTACATAVIEKEETYETCFQ